jgi:hypothetical protein
MEKKLLFFCLYMSRPKGKKERKKQAFILG